MDVFNVYTYYDMSQSEHKRALLLIKYHVELKY